MPKPRLLTNTDLLASHGLVEIYDPTVGAYRQVTREEAEKQLENLEQLKKTLKQSKPAEEDDAA